jgi:hypothetical protein
MKLFMQERRKRQFSAGDVTTSRRKYPDGLQSVSFVCLKDKY